jgi:hypothetical protein
MLYRNGWQIYPEGESADVIIYKMFDFIQKDEYKKILYLRNHLSILKKVDSILAQHSKSKLIKKLRKKQADISQEREKVYQWYLKKLSKGIKSSNFYRTFISLFPDKEISDTIRFRLAENYLRSGNTKEAIKLYFFLLTESKNKKLSEKSKEKISSLISCISDLNLCFKLFPLYKKDKITDKLDTRMRHLIENLEDPKTAKLFLKENRGSKFRDKVEKKLEIMLKERYFRARAYESVNDYRKAIKGYTEIISLAPDSEYAKKAGRFLKYWDEIRK